MSGSAFVRSRRFLPLFATQFFGAFNDNFLKNALLVMVAYGGTRSTGEVGMLSNLAAGLFIMPYFIFSVFAGQLADKFDKARYCVWVKVAEIVLMLAAAAGFLLHSEYFLLGVLFFMGAQSTFFSPAKYSLLPELLDRDELMCGNAWIEGGTYLAILAGLTAGGLVVNRPGGGMWCGAILVFFAVVGCLASRFIPHTGSGESGLRLDWNFFRQNWKILYGNVYLQRIVRICVLSDSFFWLAGSLYITVLAIFTRQTIGGSENICTLFFVLFSVGVGAGAMAANVVFKGRIAISRGVVIAIAAMALFTFDLAFLAFSGGAGSRLSDGEVLTTFRFYRASADLFLLAACGGMWSVPVQSLLQISSRRDVLARVIAGNNIVNAFFMAAGAVVMGLLTGAGLPVWGNLVLIGLLVLAGGTVTLPLVKKHRGKFSNPA